MSRPFRKSITRHIDAEGRQVPKGTPGARVVREKSAKWYGRTRGRPGSQAALHPAPRAALEPGRVGAGQGPAVPAGDRRGPARPPVPRGQRRDDEPIPVPPEDLLPLADEGPPRGGEPLRASGG